MQSASAAGPWPSFQQLFSLFEHCIATTEGLLAEIIQDIDALIHRKVIQTVQTHPSQCGIVYFYEAFLETYNRPFKRGTLGLTTPQ